MTRIWQASDNSGETVHDSMLEQFGNIANYNVVTGCGLTYSGANLDVTVAAGTITHNGSSVSVSGDTVTLQADATNPRWTWIVIDSTGTPGIVSGTPAATPTVPDVGDNVEIALVKVAAGATIASSQTAYDRRLILPRPTDTSAVQLASNATHNSTSLANITGLNVALAANTNYVFRAIVGYYAAATNNYKFGLTVPTSATVHALVSYVNTSEAGTVGTITSSGGSVTADGLGATTPGVLSVTGVVVNSTNVGNLQLQHALGSSTGTVSALTKSRLEVY